MNIYARSFLVFALASTLTACGGGGGEAETNSAPQNARPTANAGADFSVEERLSASLDGSGSQDTDGNITSYSWRQTSGQTVTIENADQASATIATPEVSPGGENLIFELTVRDDDSATGTDTITVTIENVNLPPVADAGTDRDEPERTQIQLDATASNDPDVGIASFLWRQLSGTPVTIDQPDGATTTVTTPEVTTAGGMLEFELTVLDTEGASATDSVVINVFNVNLPPTADAGPDQMVYEGRPVILDGTNSADQDGVISTYSWQLSSGIVIDIPDLNQSQISFTAPATTAPFENIYQLSVTDELGATNSDLVSVTIRPIIPPNSNAGPDQVVESESNVQLTGLGSTDPDGQIVAYQWTQITGQTVSLSNPSLADASFAAPMVAELTLLQFELTVTDDADATSTDIVDITVTPPQHDVSGIITVSDGTLVDSDVNDLVAPYASNDQPDVAQYLPNPAKVGGYSNRPFGGADGRSFSSGDISDFYRIQLTSGQSIAMYLGASIEGDLDLYLWDQSGTLILDASLSTTATEVVVAPNDGEYILEVFAWSGASTYVLEIATPAVASVNDSPASLHQNFVPHQAVVRHEKTTANGSTNSFKPAATKALGIKQAAGSPSPSALYSFEPSMEGIAALSGHQSDEISKRAEAFADPKMRSKWETLLSIKLMGADENVLYAEPNFIRQINFVPDDEFYDRQWHYSYINVPQAWDVTTGDPSIVVAVADTGVLINHPDLQGNMINGYDFISTTSISNDGDGIDPDPDDPGDGCGTESASFHGTHVAGTIGANTNNQTGVAGIAPSAMIMPLRVLGCGGGTTYDIAQAVLYAAGLTNDAGIIVDNPADVINLSLGGSGFSQSSQDIYLAARNAGVIIVAAAGNDTTSMPHYPASYEGVISVSSVGSDGSRADSSNFGPNIDVAAPGGATMSDVNSDGFPDSVYSTAGEEIVDNPIDFTYEYKMGTSMAAPHVSGVVALMKSVNSNLTPADIDAMLVRGEIVVDIGEIDWDRFYGWGLIDARIAVDAAIATAGNPPADIPAMIVSPNNVHFGAFTTDATFEISNAAGGTLVVDAISVPPEASWLSVVQQTVDPNGVGTYALTVTRAGLAEGVYTTNMTIPSNSNARVLQAKMIVPPELVFPASAGQLWVLLVDPISGNSLFGSRVILEAGQLQFMVPGVYEGTYEIIAGSDSDYDFFICDGGESCGAYTNYSNPTPVLIDMDTIDINFTVDYDWFLPAAPASVSGGIPSVDITGIGKSAQSIETDIHK